MANKNVEVGVVRNYTSVVGGFNISRSGNSILVESPNGSLTLPNGAIAKAILDEALTFVTADTPANGKTKSVKDGAKRTRRSKAEMEAARNAENVPVATVENTVGEELEVV